MTDWESELDRRFAKGFTKAAEEMGYFTTAQIVKLLSKLLTPEGDEWHIYLVEMDPEKIEEFGLHIGTAFSYLHNLPAEDFDFVVSDIGEAISTALHAMKTNLSKN